MGTQKISASACSQTGCGGGCRRRQGAAVLCGDRDAACRRRSLAASVRGRRRPGAPGGGRGAAAGHGAPCDAPARAPDRPAAVGTRAPPHQRSQARHVRRAGRVKRTQCLNTQTQPARPWTCRSGSGLCRTLAGRDARRCHPRTVGWRQRGERRRANSAPGSSVRARGRGQAQHGCGGSAGRLECPVARGGGAAIAAVAGGRARARAGRALPVSSPRGAPAGAARVASKTKCTHDEHIIVHVVAGRPRPRARARRRWRAPP